MKPKAESVHVIINATTHIILPIVSPKILLKRFVPKKWSICMCTCPTAITINPQANKFIPLPNFPPFICAAVKNA